MVYSQEPGGKDPCSWRAWTQRTWLNILKLDIIYNNQNDIKYDDNGGGRWWEILRVLLMLNVLIKRLRLFYLLKRYNSPPGRLQKFLNQSRTVWNYIHPHVGFYILYNWIVVVITTDKQQWLKVKRKIPHWKCWTCLIMKLVKSVLQHWLKLWKKIHCWKLISCLTSNSFH